MRRARISLDIRDCIIPIIYGVIITLIIIKFVLSNPAIDPTSIIPHPYSVSFSAKIELFDLTSSSVVCYDNTKPKLKTQAQFLVGYIFEQAGISVNLIGKISDDCSIIIDTGYQDSNEEAYNLTITDYKIYINGSTSRGSFYGIQTLRKLIPTQKVYSVKFYQVEIIDRPRFSFRGLLLDVSRYFQTFDNVKRFIDIMALHNMNYFHFHITDDQGWRFQSKKYPNLTLIGSMRNSTMKDGIPRGGFYTQDELRKLVQYAADRQITIVPEIDLPGHSVSALAAYPDLGCTGGPYHVAQKFGPQIDILCVGNPNTMTFIKDILTEVMEIFPSEYVHIGGDEVNKFHWRNCKKCQSRIRKLNLWDDEHSKEEYMQAYFTQELANFLASKGKKAIGWSEAAYVGKIGNLTVLSWLRHSAKEKPETFGYPTILAPTKPFYLDYRQEFVDDSTYVIKGAPVNTLRDVYTYEPIEKFHKDEDIKNILGIEACVWGEMTPNFERVMYQTLPRAAATAVAQWSEPVTKNYNSFVGSLNALTKIYDVNNWTYFKKFRQVEY